MTYSLSIKNKKENNFRFVMSRDGLIGYDKAMPCTVRFDRLETDEIISRKIDYDKYDYYCEVAHLEISSNCNMNCPYCYVGEKGEKPGLGTRQWKEIIRNLANCGIFQVSFGGGEPTLRKDLFELAKEVQKTGMNLGMTTNGILLRKLNPKKLRKYFKQINVSWHGSPEVFEEALEFLCDNNIKAGINFTFSKEYSHDIHHETVKSLAKEYNAEILYLVYKPVINDIKNQVLPEEVYKAAKQAANEGLRVAVDGPCVNRCLAKKKFVDVDCMGFVYPCSFIRKPMGNLLKERFLDVWAKRGSQDKCPYVDIKEE